MGFLNVLEGCRHNRVEHLVFASSSSVYGANTRMPFSVHQNVDHPLSLYGATKKANELMAHTYAHLYRIPVTGLRFFTVYGPWGRPDMSPFIFTGKIIRGEPIDVFNQGRHARDFTYIDDIVQGVVRANDRVAVANPEWSGDRPDPATSSAPYRLYNIGNHAPVQLMDYIACIEKAVGRTAIVNMLPMQPGDVPATFADIEDLRRQSRFRTQDADRGGHQTIRGLVSRILPLLERLRRSWIFRGQISRWNRLMLILQILRTLPQKCVFLLESFASCRQTFQQCRRSSATKLFT